MDFVPSVSRSSGLQSDGDRLKDLKFQEEYMLFIQDKLQRYWQQYSIKSHLSSEPDDKQKHAQSNIMILFRKLREGIIASRRLDDFALRVYQISMNLSVMFRMPTQTTAIVTQLIPHRHNEMGLYQTVTAKATSEPDDLSNLSKDLKSLSIQSTNVPELPQRGRKTRPIYQPPHRRRDKIQEPQRVEKTLTKPQAMTLPSRTELAILISLLNVLVQEYPRQDSFHALFRWFYCLDKETFWSKTSPSFRFVKALAETLCVDNLRRFEQLSREPAIRNLLAEITSPADVNEDLEKDLAQIAVMSFMNDLRLKVQSTAWSILRFAYREADSINSSDWLVRALMIPVPSNSKDDSSIRNIDAWLSNRPTGQVTQKEGTEGRWILHR